MKKGLKDLAERSLKSFLKKKKIGFTTALLTAFLITGGIGLASSAELAVQAQSSQEALLANIEAQKAEISALLAENERAIKEARERHQTLLRQGDYYSKSVHPSTQIFFNYSYESSGKMKDVTRKEFAHDINIVQEYIESLMSRGASGFSGTSSFSGISGLSDEWANAFIAGEMSAARLAELLLTQGNGAVSVAMPNSVEVDLGVNIVPLSPTIPVVSKDVDVSIDVPSIPNVTVSVPTPNVPSFPTITASPPTVGTITPPSVSVSVEKPEAVSTISVAAVNPITPSGVSVSVPPVNTSINAPSVTPLVVTTLIAPGPPAAPSLSLSPTAPIAPIAPPAPATPTAPTAPVVSVLTPVDITFAGTGFPQGSGKGMPQWNIIINNYETYSTTGTTITTGGSGTSWTGTVNHESGSLAASSAATPLNAYISHAADWNVVVSGNYTFIANTGGNNSKIFGSVNPYMTGNSTSADKTFDFQGTLTMHGNGAGTTEAVIGFEHQLLANGPSGGSSYSNTNTANGTTHILRNSGTIDLNSGTNMVAIMIDTEYFNGAISGTSNSAFVKLPQTINDGLIKISVGARQSVGIDYGFFYLGTGGYGPNSTVSIGNIIVDGEESYGVRLRDYYTRTDFYSRTGIRHYDLTRLEGITGKYIEVFGEKNIGISIAQGRSSGDPTGGFGHLDSAGALDNADLISNLHILVGGKENVGFYRNPNYTGTNTSAMILNSSKLGVSSGINTVVFDSDAAQSTLFRSDRDELILDSSINLNLSLTTSAADNALGLGVKNTAMQAGASGTGTGIVTNRGSIIATANEFYGLTAGFGGMTGSTANNTGGTIVLTGNGNIGIAIDSSNNGSNTGIISMLGDNSTGVYNLGTFTDSSAASVTVNGANSIGIYNDGTYTVINSDITASGASSKGIFNATGNTIGSLLGDIDISGANSIGIYNQGTLGSTGIPTQVVVDITSGSNVIGVYNTGAAYLSSTSTITGSGGTSSIGVYHTGSALTLNGVAITLGSGSTGLYLAANSTISGSIGINGGNARGIYNTATATMGAMPITITNATGGVGIFNTGTITATNNGDVSLTNGLNPVGIGIQNTGTITGWDGDITAASAIINDGGSASITGTGTNTITAATTNGSVGIYNTGTLTLGSSTINSNVSGSTDTTSIFNSGTMSFANGTITVAGNDSAAIYSIGTSLSITGSTPSTITATGTGSAGVYNTIGTVNITNASISATNTGSAGVSNTGINFTLGEGTIAGNVVGLYNAGGANIGSAGPVSVTASTAGGSTGIYNTNNLVMEDTDVTSGGTGSSGIYNDGTINYDGANSITVTNEATGLYVSAGIVNNGGGTLDISLNNTSPTDPGVGVYARNDGTTGSTVNLTGSTINVVNGSSAVASYGLSSSIITNINLTNATISYNGNGFAIYSNGAFGRINLTGATLNLDGNAIGMEIDYSSTPSVTLSGTTTINVDSNGVMLASLKNYGGTIAVSNMLLGVSGALGGATIVENATDYILARVDGGIISIDTDITKGATSGPGHDYYNRFQGQRIQTTVTGTTTVTAIMNAAQAAAYNNQVVAIESSSSANATSVSQTSVTLDSGAQIIAAMTTAGDPGAVGIFSNFGEVTLDIGSSITIQNGHDSVEDGVGIFAVNGSIVNSDGTVTVHGDNGIGIFSMGYRDDSGTIMIDEFGGLTGEGEQNVTNTGTIDMRGAGAIGIYGVNNTAGDVTAADSLLVNTGSILMADGTASNMSIGIYGDGVSAVDGITIENSGTITVGDYGVGIYGIHAIIQGDGTGDLGTINIGGNSVGIVAEDSILSGVTTLTLDTSDTLGLDKIGITFENSVSDIDFDIFGGSFEKGTLIHLDNIGINFIYGITPHMMEVGKYGVGIYLANSTGMTAENAGTIDLLSTSDEAIGMYTNDGDIENTGVINILSNFDQIGMYASGSTTAVDNSGGTINIGGNTGIGIYLENGVTATNGSLAGVNFGATVQNAVGIVLNGNSASDITGGSLVSANAARNILAFAQDGSQITNLGTANIDGNGYVGGVTTKTIGVYLNNNTSTQNTYGGMGTNLLVVEGAALGIYSNGDNLIKDATIEAKDNGSVGIYLDGQGELDNLEILANNAFANESVVGIYATGGPVTITNGLDIELGTIAGSDYGTGMYLSNGATVTGTPITISNNSTQTNVGLYYTNSGGTPLAQGVDISLFGNNLVGIYVDDGMTLTNANTINYFGGSTQLVGTYVDFGSTYISTSATDIIGADQSAGILAGNGLGINRGTLEVTASTGDSGAMVAIGKNLGDVARILNDTTGALQVTNGVGMLVDGDITNSGTSHGENLGTIAVTGASSAGVVVSGPNSTFDGTGGTINATGSQSVGIYLADTDTNQIISTGTLNMGASDSIGVYANSSKVDFNITVPSTVANGIALLASGTAATPTEITSIIDGSSASAPNPGLISVYLENGNVIFSGSTIKTAEKGIGLYFNKNTITNYALSGVTIDSLETDGVGIYVDDLTLDYGITTNVDNGGIGLYVTGPSGVLDTNNGIVNIDGGLSSLGIMLAGGTGNLGVAGNFTINFGAGGGIGVLVQGGGTLNLGSMLTVTGLGILAAAENSNLSNSTTLTVNGLMGLLGNFTSGGPYKLENTSSGIINITNGGTGIAALGVPGAATVTAINDGVINVEGAAGLNSSVGIYTTIAEVQNNSVINVGQDAVGIFARGTNNTISSNNINLQDPDSIGIMIQGAIAGLTSASITGVDNTTGIYLSNANVSGVVNGGIINLGDDGVGIYAEDTTATISGDITIGDQVSGSPIGILASGTSTITLAPGTVITAGKGAIAVGASDGATVSGVDVSDITLSQGGVHLYVGNGGTIVGTGTLEADDNIGLMIDGTGAPSTITGITQIDVKNGGVGAYILNNGTLPTGLTVDILDGIGGSTPKYSIGVYYSGATAGAGTPIILPTFNQVGEYTIGAAFEEGTDAVISGTIATTSAAGKNQVSVMSKGTATLGNILKTDTIIVAGSENIGLYGEYSDLTTGDIILGASAPSSDKSTASIGIYGKNSSITTDDLYVGNYSIGIYGDTIGAGGITTNDITVGENAIGIYGTGSGLITTTGVVAVGKTSSIGVYGSDVNISVTGPLMTVEEGTSVGVVSENGGNVNYSGAMIIADKGADTGSIGIYKKGTGIVTTGADNWIVGESGYGLYLIEDGIAGVPNIAINNATMNLGMSAVGIYGEGADVEIRNNGHIIVGETDIAGDHSFKADHKNSVGIYLTEKAQGVNTGIIDVLETHSAGVYVHGEDAYFENAVGGIINVDNGATGILVKRYTDPSMLIGGIAVNNGIINLGNSNGPIIANTVNVGMAAYEGSTIINGTTGIINVSSGTAMYIATGGILDNQGEINIYGASGVGVQGAGTVVNAGIINLIGGMGLAKDTDSAVVREGSVVIDGTGITINGNYITVGGTITADAPIILNGAFVDIRNFRGEIPLFQAPDVSGVIKLVPSFATLGNGYAFVVDNFTKSLVAGGVSGTVTVETSPMFITNVGLGGELFVAKKPYVELLAPGTMTTTESSQFKNLYDGLDEILYSDPTGTSKDSLVLKGLNEYLETIYASSGTEAFNAEASRTISETRGDVYGTIQKRMQTIQKSFDGSFEELLSSYNTTKDSGKFSVMYTRGDYKDDTLGVDEYDYSIQGLLYMKEFEGRNFGNKWGYTLGFAVSKFDFDDGPTYGSKSKEDVYSLRTGIHNVKNFNEEDSLRLVSRLELGYNRHETTRVLELDKVYKNKGKYDTYQVTLDNRLEKTVYRSMTSKVDLFAGLNLEYGIVNSFSESGSLALKVKDNDYFSIQPEIGIKAEKRSYLGSKLSVKLYAEGSYAYELGDNYDRNKAKISSVDSEWYNLIKPEDEEGFFKGVLGLSLERSNKIGVSFDTEARKHDNKKDADLRYNLRLKYVF